MVSKAAKRPMAKERVRAKATNSLKPASPAPVIPRSRLLVISARPGEADREVARTHLTDVPAALVAVDFAGPMAGDLSLMEAIAVLREKSDAVNKGDLKEAEALLMGQAIALNVIFSELARRAKLNLGEYLDAGDKYLRLALKAQSQCRATLETLAAVKNPPVLFAKQANFANGPQQVNNGSTRTGNPKAGQNELMAVDHGERLDVGKAGKAITGDTPLASVGTIHGAEKP